MSLKTNSRASAILKAGLQASAYADKELLTAIAAMIAEATKPAKKAKSKSTTLYNEKDVMSATGLEFEVSRWGVLQRKLSGMVLKDNDLELFSSWFSSSMLPWAQENGVVITYSMLAKKYESWLERARQRGNGTSDGADTNAWR